MRTKVINLADRLAARIHGRLSVHKDFRDRCRDLTIRYKDGSSGAFIWNSAQEVYWRHRPAKGKIKLMKYRQGGFSTLEMAESYDTWKRVSDSQQLFLADIKERALKIFRICSRLHMKDLERPTLATPARKTKLEGVNGSLIQVGTAGGSAPGRGETLTKVHGSEVPYWKGDHAEVEFIVSGFAEAAAQGLIILEGTPNGAIGWWFDTWFEPDEWTKIFITWFMDPANQIRGLSKDQESEILDTLNEEEKNLIGRHSLTLNQLAWRRAKKRELGQLFYQEFPEDDRTCFLVKGLTLYSLESLDAALLAAPEPVASRYDPMHQFEQFLAEPVSGERYFISGDFALGVKRTGKKKNSKLGDWNAASIRDAKGFQVKVIRTKDRPEDFARLLVKEARQWNDALLAPEANNMGRSAINTIANECAYPNIVLQRAWDGRQWVVTNQLGWLTTGHSRDVMLQDHKEDFESGGLKVNSRLQLGEMRNVILDGNRYEGVPHDDMVMSDAILNQVLKFEAANFCPVL